MLFLSAASEGRRLYIDYWWEKDMGDLLFFCSAQGGGMYCFLLSELSLTLVVVV